MDARRVQWAGFVAASLAAGMAGSLYAFSRAASRPTRWPSAARSTGWSWCCSAGCNRWPVRWPARRPIPAAGRGRAQHRILARAAGAGHPGPGHGVSRRARRRGGALDPPAVASERREMSAPPCSRSATCASPSAASTRWPACRSRSAGQMLALIGPNGAGKSTCFNALGGQVRPDTGSVRRTAANWSACPPRVSAASAWAARSRPPPCSAP